MVPGCDGADPPGKSRPTLPGARIPPTTQPPSSWRHGAEQGESKGGATQARGRTRRRSRRRKSSREEEQEQAAAEGTEEYLNVSQDTFSLTRTYTHTYTLKHTHTHSNTFTLTYAACTTLSDLSDSNGG